MQITDFTWSAVTSALALLIAIASGYLVIRGLNKAHREDAAEREQPMRELTQRLTADEARMDRHEEQINQLRNRTDKQAEELRLVLKSQLALLRHGVDGNNILGLKECQTEIQNYLIER